MDTKALRQKILDLAIHGKLVPQDPNDEPASVLLERIRAEKERLIKDGKIKKGKKSAKTSDKPHYPYELPKGWEWCKLGDIAYVGTGATPLTACKYYYENGNIAWINSSSTKVPFIVKASNFITQKAIEETNCLIYPKGTLVIAMYGEGKTRGQISELLIDAATNQACAAVRPYSEATKEYLKLFFEGNYLHIRAMAEGGNQPNLSVGKIQNYEIPLPPLNEQKRILDKAKKMLLQIDNVETGKRGCQKDIKQAKSKILDLAIHGKLVPQDPNDEPASELLKRINPKAEIISDNGHYQKIPKNWCLTKGKYIFNQMKSIKPTGETFKYIDIESIDNKRQIINNIKTLKVSNAPSRASRYTQKGDVVFSLVRPYLRNIAMVSEDDCIASTGFYVCHPAEVLSSKYCYYLMISDYVVDGVNEFMKGDNSPSINKSDIDNWVYPLPPLAEQERIVSKIEEIFTQLAAIETAL